MRDTKISIDERQRYQHYKGGYYRFICFAFSEATEEQLVIYESETGYTTWCQSYDRFHETFTGDNGARFTRFTKC